MRPLRPKDLRTPPLPKGSAAATSAAQHRAVPSQAGKSSGRKGTWSPTQSTRIATGLRSRLAGSVLRLGSPPPSSPSSAAAAAAATSPDSVAEFSLPEEKDPRGELSAHQSVRVASGLRTRLAGSFMGIGNPPSSPSAAAAEREGGKRPAAPAPAPVIVETVDENEEVDDDCDSEIGEEKYVSLSDELAKKKEREEKKKKKKVKVHREDLVDGNERGRRMLGVLKRLCFGGRGCKERRWSSWNPCLKAIEAEKPR